MPKKDGKIDLCRKDGASPLYVACQRGYYNIVKLLLKQGAEINLCLKYVTTPLYAASENGHEKTVQLLLDNKADSDIITSSLYSLSLSNSRNISEQRRKHKFVYEKTETVLSMQHV